MDNEIKDILVKLLEGQTRLEGKVDGIETEVKGLETEVKGLETEVKGLETEVKKNSIKLETIEKNINIIAELQTAHKEQYETLFKNTDALIEEKTDLIETAVISVSKDVKEAKESIEVLKDMTGRHEVDINILKRRENVHKFV